MLSDFIHITCMMTWVITIFRILEMFIVHFWTYESYQRSDYSPVSSRIKSFLADHTNLFIKMMFVLLLTVVVFLVNQNWSKEERSDDSTLSIALVIVAITNVLCRRFLFKESKQGTSKLNLFHSDMFNVGRSAAINYVENYLEYVIPSLPSGLRSHKGLVARIDAFILQQNSQIQLRDSKSWRDSVPFDTSSPAELSFPAKYLFVLIPKSGNIEYGTLDAADSYIKYVGNLESVTLDLGSHQRRDYKNSVYCYKGDHRKCFAIEFATPLSSLCEMKKHFPQGQIPDQIETFYKGLTDYLKDKLTYGNLVKLVYYDDGLHEHALSEAIYRSVNRLQLLQRR